VTIRRCWRGFGRSLPEELTKGTDEYVMTILGPLKSQATTWPSAHTNDALYAMFRGGTAGVGMIEPSRYLAELTAKAGHPSYFYRFAYVPEAPAGKGPMTMTSSFPSLVAIHLCR
jgi:hypothetical protein